MNLYPNIVFLNISNFMFKEDMKINHQYLNCGTSDHKI